MDTEKMNPSRREFLSGAAVTAVAVAGGVNLATTPAAAAEKAADVKADETIEAQVVVAGSGLGGFAAP
jgi:nitrous oxide reductase